MPCEMVKTLRSPPPLRSMRMPSVACARASSRQPITSPSATGGIAGADIEEDGELTLLLYRRDGDPRLREAGAEVWLEDDPIQPPLILIFKRSRYDYPAEARQRAATCFTREYRRLLRLWSADGERGAAGRPRPLGERDSATIP